MSAQSHELTWQHLLGDEKQKSYFTELMKFVEAERASGQIVYPPQHEVFNALKLCEANKVRVVIIGQDPYHGPNQAHGLCFSVKQGNKIPPSLRNIYKELSQDIPGFCVPEHGELTHWAKQGVLLLNTVLTVRDGQAHSHKNKGWETFTDTVISKVSEATQGVVFLLWGGPAQKKMSLIDTTKHYVLRSAHPSPLSAHRGFLGCGHFSETNRILLKNGHSAIDWQV
ncbi:uracil-DNA glycosylase [Glaciecola siphonariae]|uniref:Uracil-DNA glycosylase n=1 Tax=Glaciecola siphonariae TaxID=521012 RepID=A0ABV9LUZ9_9ALTE